ncbi:CPCC family cysteine-rich protein [Priestia abyssalis]|uniref:CPCC family cysteine-rich protein n=1 Tax=Priestia abyssalis TaxID=1221450 RepID=UPI001115F303|nr:CPCC family cysteine-rich protein [Priestia abyssalis]
MRYTCPCCGFKTLDEPFSYHICKVCHWEDDPTQLEYPALDLGPNDGSLCEGQAKILRTIPITIKDYEDFSRDDEWRPLHSDECIKPSKPHKTGMDYFNLIGEEQFKYYWKK